MEPKHSYSETLSGESRTVSHQVSTKRMVRRVREPRLPFVSYGLIPALGLGALLLFGLTSFAHNWIEGTVEKSSRASLASVAPWARATASGQFVTLTGCPPNDAAEIRAVDAINRARANTFLGKATVATRVIPKFDCANADVPSIVAGNDDWTYRLENGLLRLEGEVPDEDTRTALADAARTMVDPPRISRVENSLTVSGKDLPDGYFSVAMRGLKTLGRCDRGAASFVSETYSLTCEISSDRAANVRNMAGEVPAFGQLGSINIIETDLSRAPVSEAAAATCNDALARLLENTKIEFATSSATISTSSYNLLDLLAEEIKACPGVLVIEGHTDSTGSVVMNEELSRRRAESVRAALVARGVSSTRLVAQGYGPSRPIASNQTAVGRARNRRIEIRVSGSSE